MRQLIRAGLVQRSGMPPAATYWFNHALIRDAAYESQQRATVRSCTAASLRFCRYNSRISRIPNRSCWRPVSSESGAFLEAIPYWERAGLHAASRVSHVEAAGHFGAALRLLRSVPDTAERDQQELQLSLRLALSQSPYFGYAAPEVRAILTQAHELCDRLGNVAELFPVLGGLCTFHIVSSDLAVAEELGRLCLQIGQQTGRPEYTIEGDTPLGYNLFSRGNSAPRNSISSAPTGHMTSTLIGDSCFPPSRIQKWRARAWRLLPCTPKVMSRARNGPAAMRSPSRDR